MSQEQKEAANGNSNEGIMPGSASNEYITEADDNTRNSEYKTTNASDIHQEPINVVVNIPQDENRPQKRANLIAWIGLSVNAILAFFTYMLFLKTQEANKTSSDALKETKIAVAEAKRANDIAEDNYELAKQSSLNGDSISAQTIKNQIMALKETQKEFRISNEPYLQILAPQFKELIDDKNLTVKYVLKNYGQLPAIISKQWTGIVWSKAEDLPELMKNPTHYMPFKSHPNPSVSMIVAKESSDTGSITYATKIDKSQIEALFNQKLIAYYYGKIIYSSPTHPINHEYKFLLRFTFERDTIKNTQTFGYSPLYNSRSELKR